MADKISSVTPTPIILKSIFHFSYLLHRLWYGARVYAYVMRIFIKHQNLCLHTYSYINSNTSYDHTTNKIHWKMSFVSVENNVIMHIILWYKFLRFFLVFTLEWRACKTKQIIKDNVHGNNAMWNETIYMGCFVFRIIIQARIIAFI